MMRKSPQENNDLSDEWVCLADVTLQDRQTAEAHDLSQQKKRGALFFATDNVSVFYSTLIKNANFTIIIKFQQSGRNGFLPPDNLGVCAFMSNDFARAVTEGRFVCWQEKITTRDKQMIERLCAGQSRLGIKFEDLHELERSIRGMPPSIFETNNIAAVNSAEEEFQTSALAAQTISNAFKGFREDDSCMMSPCVFLNITLTKKCLFNPKPVGHGMMFTMAITPNNTIDPAHLFFMNSDIGIFKIKNTVESIEEFLLLIDQKLYSEYSIGEFRTSLLNKNLWLPLESEPHWREQEQAIIAGTFFDYPNNYSLSDECLIDEYLRIEINRLAELTTDKVCGITNLLFEGSDDKLKELKDIRLKLQEYLNNNPSKNSSTSKQGWEEFKMQLLDAIDKCIVRKRCRLGVSQSTSKENFEKLIERLNDQPRTMSYGAHTGGFRAC